MRMPAGLVATSHVLRARDLVGAHRRCVTDEDPSYLGDRERVGCRRGRHAHDPAESTRHALYDDIDRSVCQTLLAVPAGTAGISPYGYLQDRRSQPWRRARLVPAGT
jgi:hypothetical protein